MKIETLKTIAIAVLVTLIVAGLAGFITGNRYANAQNVKSLQAVKTLK